MRINVTRTLEDDARRQKEVKPLPKVSIGRSGQSGNKVRVVIDKQRARDEKQQMLSSLWGEMGAIKRARGKLSSQTSFIVLEIENKLRADNAGTADEFMKGNLPMPELADHYRKIQELTDQAKDLFDKIQYVDQNGKMPAPIRPKALIRDPESVDAAAIKHEIRRLDDLICKTNKKLDQGRPRKSTKESEWRVKVSMAEDRRDALKRQLKEMYEEAKEET